MDYIIVVLVGLIGASLINIYVDFENRYRPYYKWCRELYYKNISHMAVSILLPILYLLLYKGYGATMEFVKYSLLLAVLSAASIKDLQSKTIPNKLVIFGLITGVALAVIRLDANVLINCVLGLIAAGGVLGLVNFVTKGGIGMGDIKLFACAGVFLGLSKVMSAMLVSIVASGIFGAILLIFRLSSRKGTIPFAPFVLAGAILSVLYS